MCQMFLDEVDVPYEEVPFFTETFELAWLRLKVKLYFQLRDLDNSMDSDDSDEPE